MSVIVVPLKADKVEEWKNWMDECLGPRREEFEDMHERMGITSRRVWLARSPQGPMAIVVVDGPGADDLPRKLAESQEPFDKWFRDHVAEYYGGDFSEIAEMNPSEMVMDWYAPSYMDVTE